MSEFTDKPYEKPIEKHVEKIVVKVEKIEKIEPIIKNVCICSGSRHFQCPLHK